MERFCAKCLLFHSSTGGCYIQKENFGAKQTKRQKLDISANMEIDEDMIESDIDEQIVRADEQAQMDAENEEAFFNTIHNKATNKRSLSTLDALADDMEKNAKYRIMFVLFTLNSPFLCLLFFLSNRNFFIQTS